MRLAGVVGFALGLSLANCGKDPATIHGTALYVVAYFTSSGYDIRSLYFLGQTAGGNDLFEASYRPVMPAATKLGSPQQVRIYLGDDQGGKKVTVSLYAVDKDGEFVQFGAANVTVERGREVEVPIDMTPFDLPDAGMNDAGDYVDSGFFDAGYIDGGRLQDGGMIPCACDGGCCFPGTSNCFVPAAAVLDAGAGTLPVVYTFQVCGPPSGFCSPSLCEPSRTNTCHNGSCSCGKSGPCPVGTRCSITPNGNSICVCDFFSQCQGCCNTAGTICVTPNLLTRVACGSAGQQCQPCGAVANGGAGGGTGGGFLDAGNITCQQGTIAMPSVEQPGVCSTSVTCGACKLDGQCCSEMKCAPAGWPRCRKPNANVCIACDLLRTSQCSATLGCVCGNETGPCNAQQFCDRGNGVPRCRAF